MISKLEAFKMLTVSMGTFIFARRDKSSLRIFAASVELAESLPPFQWTEEFLPFPGIQAVSDIK